VTKSLYTISINLYPMPQKDYLREYTGEWILLFNDEIIDHSTNLEEVLKIADERFPSDKVPQENVKISKVLSGNIHLR